jgi:hypothetical protein
MEGVAWGLLGLGADSFDNALRMTKERQGELSAVDLTTTQQQYNPEKADNQARPQGRMRNQKMKLNLLDDLII